MQISKLNKAIELLELHDKQDGNEIILDEALQNLYEIRNTMSRISASNPAEYFHQLFEKDICDYTCHYKQPMKLSVRQEYLKSWEDFPLDSYCGQVCITILDKTKELLTICADSHEDVVDNILKGAVTAMEICCFG